MDLLVRQVAWSRLAVRAGRKRTDLPAYAFAELLSYICKYIYMLHMGRVCIKRCIDRLHAVGTSTAAVRTWASRGHVCIYCIYCCCCIFICLLNLTCGSTTAVLLFSGAHIRHALCHECCVSVRTSETSSVLRIHKYNSGISQL